MNIQYDSLVPPVSKLFGRFGMEVGFVIPTETGMRKSILDATWPLREYMARTGFHNYNKQAKGTSAKRICPLHFIVKSGVELTKISLYRPETKDGDPRLWIYEFSKFASAGELVAIIIDGKKLYAVNCSRINLEAELGNSSSVLGKLAAKLDTNADAAAELLSKLRAIGGKGFMPSLRLGDTGIGFTLETELGIAANSSRAPDFRGIEIKSGRMHARRRSASSRHVTLFSNVPSWNHSPFNARNALETFGYNDKKTGRLQLFCSIDAKRENSLGFLLDTRPENNHLVNVNKHRKPPGEDVFIWFWDALKTSFSAKHNETFWVGAKSQFIDGIEHFHYVEARHTRKPPISTFERLIADGGICVDLTMSDRGNTAVRDHGYLFRIYGNRFDELFPEVGTYPLV